MKPADIIWKDGQPYSNQFGDIYYSKAGGLEESRYVFLQHNGLPRRWNQKNFTLIETGFGTGLNFLATWQAWQSHVPSKAQLHYIAIEQFPLKLEDMRQAVAAWPELAEFSKQLLKVYPPLVEGFYPLEFEDKSIRLTLIFGDANIVLAQLVAKADAWYLDGFSPKHNPELWHDKIFSDMAKLSAPGCSIATFTAAGSVRRGLENAGFSINKVRGHGPKKAMLCGSYLAQSDSILPAWFALPKPRTSLKKIAVIGGGIAGISCAYSLIKRGFEVDLFEAKPEIATLASSNAFAILKPHLSPNFNLADQYYTQGFFYTSQVINELRDKGLDFSYKLNGLLHLASTSTLAERFNKIVNKRDLPADFAEYVDYVRASQLASISLNHSGLFYKTAGVVNLYELCQALVKACGTKLKLHTGIKISQLAQVQEDWLLYNNEGQKVCQAETVIIANASQAKDLAICQDYPLSALPGQLSLISATTTSECLNIPLAYEGYITPALNGQHIMGSTYRHGREHDLAEASCDHQLVASYLHKVAPQLDFAMEKATAWVNVRSVSPDHLPLVGPVMAKNHFIQTYQNLTQGNTRKNYEPAQYYPNLFISSGHGSKGLSSSLLAAEIITSLMTDQALPVSAKIYQAIHPSRFWLRQLKRAQPSHS